MWAQGATTEGHVTFLLAGPVAVYLCFLVVCLLSCFLILIVTHSPQVRGSDLGKVGALILKPYRVVVFFLPVLGES